MFGRFSASVLAVGVVGILAGGAWGSVGCSATKPTEIVPGALTQVQVPKSLAGIRVVVKAGGQIPYDKSFEVKNGSVILPATLGVVSGGNAATIVEVLIAGYDQAYVSGPHWQDFTQPVGVVGQPDGPKVKRGSIQTYVDQHTIFLPMNLSYSCWGQDCENDGGTDTDTCKAATCNTNVTDPHTLADFDPSMVDGTQDCFSPSNCFNPVVGTGTPPSTGVLTATPVPGKDCTFEVPNGPGIVNGPGLNVRVIYQDFKLPGLDGGTVPYNDATSEQEILNVEPYDPAHGLPVEGFAIPDSNQPYQFVLAPGLCNLVNNETTPPKAAQPGGPHYHAISAVQVSTTCTSKPPLLPICATEQNQQTQTSSGTPTTDVICNQPITLVQAPSAIYLVMDDSSIMAGAYGKDGYATTMGLALGNPVFKRTFVGFEFMDHNVADCTTNTPTAYATPGSGVPNSIDFALANLAQPKIAQQLLAPPYPDPVPDGGQPVGGFQPLFLEGALRADVGVFKHLSDFASQLASHQDGVEVGAAMFFVNRQPVTTSQPITFIDGGVNMVPPAQYTPPIGQDCFSGVNDGGTPAQDTLVQEIAAADKLGLQTYIVVLANGLYQVADPLVYYQQLQTAVKAAGVSTMQVLDATEPKSQIASILQRFSNTATALGTCLYELPPGIDKTAHVQFTIPIPLPQAGLTTAPAPFPVTTYDPNCNAANQNTANGWAIDGNHIRICGTPCSDLRQTVQGVSANALLGGLDAGTGSTDGGTPLVPEVPVTVTMSCADGGTTP